MALASHQFCVRLQRFPSSQINHLLVGRHIPYLSLRRVPLTTSSLTFSRRRGNANCAITSSSKKNKRQNKNDTMAEDDLDEDAFEALFKQLEEDLKNDNQSLGDADEDITEEDLARLECELEEVLAEDDDLSGLFNSMANAADGGAEEVVDENQKEEDEDEQVVQVKLKGWQLRRLAYALKTGRRKTSIKNLAAEVCLDRAVVLELLRDPPPSLLMMSATLPDNPEPEIYTPLPDKLEPTISMPETTEAESVSFDTATKSTESDAKVKPPIHVLQSSWSAQKRLKKVQAETLEKVYRRSKRPTNAMISSIVQVTNLPRKKIVKWFEDKRAAEGVPDHHRRPYQRSTSETVFSQ
ncbi:hypothetical protein Nepgr_000852 [Nepenthes gracilis]|uniref:Homeobox domain-containing protein n=1 Tax=Nepenthes gracilis TaxID=150966 RepID=A0AAD3RX72_NEPGR|nr:hypothetical protein Nepgr_000852 [Nepenthes gracilis]